MKPWLEDATGIQLKDDSIDMFCAKYSHTDHLLCHDDELMGRRIAYMYVREFLLWKRHFFLDFTVDLLLQHVLYTGLEFRGWWVTRLVFG